MAHRALTLKYRPQVFADLVGQEHVSMVLARALESRRIAHAYLFTGARGVGKTTSARILAKALNCERRASGELKGADPCNACTSCLEITNGVSLDVAEIDGASNRGIADVQALREKVRFSPTGGRYRVVIIDEVHQLSNDAFAALLKTLEEPPAHLVFIFATTDPQKLPDTIRSRTQRFDFARVPIRKVADRLLDIARREADDPEGVHFQLREGAALLIAQKSEGALRDAVSALDQVVSAGETEVDEELVRRILGLADREAFFALADAITRRDPQATLRRLHEAFAKGLDARDLADGLSEHVRHMLVLKIDPEGHDLVPATREELERLREQGASWSEHDLLRLLRIASESLIPMKESPQPLVHLEAAVLQMATLEPGETLSELLGRLEALERRLGGGAAPSAPGAAPRSAPAPAAKPATTTTRWGGGTGGASLRPPAATPGARTPRAEDEAPVIAAVPATRVSTTASAPQQPPVAVAARMTAAPPPRAALSPAAEAALAVAEPIVTRASASIARSAPAATDESFVADARSQALWRDVVLAVNGRKRMLGAFLEETTFLGVSDAALALATDDLHRAVIEEGENVRLLGEEVRRAFGQPLRLVCGAGAKPAAPVAVEEPVDVKAMIARTIAWFDGEAIQPAEPRPERPVPRWKERNG